MPIVMLLFLWLSAIIPLASSCVDLLFVVDPHEERSVVRAVKIANELGQRGLSPSVITKKGKRFLSIIAKNKSDLIELLHSIQGTYKELLKTVSKKIARRKVERPLIVLLFAETDVPQELTASWNEMKNSTLHIFRVGTSNNREIIRQNEGISFDQLISCAKRIHGATDVRRRGLLHPSSESTNAEKNSGSTTSRTTKHHPIFKGATTAPRVTTDKTILRTAGPSTTLGTVPARVKNRFGRKQPVPPGAVQKITTVSVGHTTTSRPIPSGCIIDIIFLVDFSKGTGEKSQSYFDIAASSVAFLPIGLKTVRIAMIGYSGPGRATALFHLDKHGNKDDVIEFFLLFTVVINFFFRELFRMEQHGGTTRTAEALRFAKKEFGNPRHGARKEAKKFIVLFTDGYSQDDPVPAAEEARRDGIQIITVAVSDSLGINEKALREISGSNDLVLISPHGQQIRDRLLGHGCNL